MLEPDQDFFREQFQAYTVPGQDNAHALTFIAMVGACHQDRYAGRKLSIFDQIYLRAAFSDLCEKKIAISDQFSLRVVNNEELDGKFGEGPDFLDPDLSLEADFVVVCNVASAKEPVMRRAMDALMEEKDVLGVKYSPHEISNTNAWADSAERCGAKVVYIVGSVPINVGADDFCPQGQFRRLQEGDDSVLVHRDFESPAATHP